MAERENIVLPKGQEHTFTQENIGKYKIVAHRGGTAGSEKEEIYAIREIRIIDPTPIGNITPSTTPASAFITGTDTQYFSILYRLTPEYTYTVDELNAAAYTYIKDWNSMVSNEQKIQVSDRPDEKPVYFGEDSNGIFALLNSAGYAIDNYDENNIYISGDNTYIKAYIKGTCSIVDVDYSNENNLDMIPSIAYPLTFLSGNGKLSTYLFVNSNIQLLKTIDINNNTFMFIGSKEANSYTKCNAPESLLVSKSLSACQKISNYILKFAERNGELYKIKTTSDSTNDKTVMMISGGTNRNLIIPETIKKISHFYGGGAGNNENIILPSSLIEIGESAFEGMAGGSITLREYNNNLEVIGEQAFANISNVRIFEFDTTKDKEFILSNMCRGDSTDISKLLLDREQLSNVLDTLASKSVKSICLLPRVKEIKDCAFENAKNSTSISNIAFSNIGSSVGAAAFLNAEIKNLIIPDPLIVRPESPDNPNTITSSGLLYLPESAIDLACRNLDLTYTHEMKDTIHIDQSVDLKDGYYYDGYDFKPQENNNRLTWLIGNTYKFYKDSSQRYKTFSHINKNSDQTYYFIHKASK